MAPWLAPGGHCQFGHQKLLTTGLPKAVLRTTPAEPRPSVSSLPGLVSSFPVRERGSPRPPALAPPTRTCGFPGGSWEPANARGSLNNEFGRLLSRSKHAYLSALERGPPGLRGHGLAAVDVGQLAPGIDGRVCLVLEFQLACLR